MSHRRRTFIVSSNHFEIEPTNFVTSDKKPTGTQQVASLAVDRSVLHATVGMFNILNQCNPELDFSSLFQRPITTPSTPVKNNNKDNENNDFIIYSEQLLGTGVDPTQTTGKMPNSRYKVLSGLGQGAFGQVVKAFDEVNNREVAIKVLKNRPPYMRQGMLEIAVLELINSRFDVDCSGHTLRLFDHFVFYNHICIVTELLGMNLFELLKQQQCKGLKLRLAVLILKQVGESLDVLYNNNIAHCDLKPENILLVDNTTNIRLIDFGSSCFENSTLYTYIQSRHYRSPEVILGIKYNSAIDMWSFGCIAAELILGIPIFPGSSEYNQLERIIKMLGMPPRNVLEQGTNTRKYFKMEVNGWVFKSRDEFEFENKCKLEPFKQFHHYKSLEHFTERLSLTIKSPQNLKLARVSYLDFLNRTLCWDPEIRLTPGQALKHPFLQNRILPQMYQPPSPVPPCRNFPGDSALSADDALKIVCPPSVMPSKFKYQTYTCNAYYSVFTSALDKGIVLNILNPNPFTLQPMTPPVLAWEEAQRRKREKERKRRDGAKKKDRKDRNETFDGRKFEGGQSIGGNSLKSGDSFIFSPGSRQDSYKSPAQSWSKYHPMVMPKDN
ncbi:hypothetical protein EIN_021150 [Entamoeba invadens IP1]|uniref:hypothetical protein n=1 Tax=Entamoeba invadens IP1 TaxID=370355 RepID=UPI0002C3E901|nr:hypothetical protein EIN_021150 [Entamoeba invadens IP1]ELP90606.1 hypothetical protein EIN_021150 [Entamoeba invadens IP1]|eukprot:XP_004257377.1 hypothetical protein EIN_021150 [Entamoeba invadens IP1]